MATGSATYGHIVFAMVRTGILGYGGGPSVIPLIRYEAVTRYRWLDDNEFGETLALANALPGPIAPKMAAYLGYKLKGTLGATVAILAHILPTSLAVIALLGTLYSLQHSKIVAGMIAAVRPVIFVMLAMMAYEFIAKSWKGLGKAFALLFSAVAFALLFFANVHPGIVVVLFLGYGAFHLTWVERYRRRKDTSA